MKRLAVKERDPDRAADEYDPAKLESREFEQWVQGLIKNAVEGGYLVTERQKKDLNAKRTLRSGDRARYVGPDRDEDLGDHKVRRPHGQMGHIVSVTRSKVGQFVYEFMPDTNAAEKEVVKLTTAKWTDLERVT
jgi:hypothetical protein